MKLQRRRIRIDDLTIDQKESMFELMFKYYENTNRADFDNDLQEKDWALVLIEEGEERIVGFSTQMLMREEFEGTSINVLYSGDTIIAQAYWGNGLLSLAFSELMIDLLEQYPNDPLFWLLISKGLRTYKYLPNCFIEYYPNCDREIPEDISRLMHHLGRVKFGERYDPGSGVVSADKNGQFLRHQYQPIKRDRRPFESFFYRRNPGYLKGDELLCLARLSLDNVKPSILRALEKVK